MEERLGARTFAGCLGREKIYGLATLLAPGSKEKNPPLEGQTFEGRIAKGEEEGLSLVLTTEEVIGISLFDIFEGIELCHRRTTDRLGDRVADVAGWIGLLQTD